MGSSVLGSLLALLVGLAVGAAALTWWEGGRQSAEIETLKQRQADERAQVQSKIKQLTDELNAEKQRRESLEQVVQQAQTQSGKRR
jgi:Tfp pilus assembly protein PilN